MRQLGNTISIIIFLLITACFTANIRQQHSSLERILQTQNSWSLRTRIKTVENNTQLETIITLYQGLNGSITEQSLLSGSKVLRILTDPLTGSQKATQVNISRVTIQQSRQFLIYTTSAPIQNSEIPNSRVRIQFTANTLIDVNQQAYSVLIQDYKLSQPYFYSSFYHNYQTNLLDQLLGITFTLVALILAIMGLVELKCFHQCMAYYMLIQLIGLLRLKQYPIVQASYPVLSGFRHTQVSFIPNLFFNLFPFGYQEESYDSLQFEFGDNNFIRNFGSPLLVFLILEAFVLAYLAFACFSEEKQKLLKKFIMLQDFVFICVLVKLVFSIVLSIAALNMDLSKVVWTTSFALSQVFAFLCAIVIIGYLIWIFHIPQNRPIQLYKLAFISMGIACWIVMQNIFAGVILMLIILIGFTIIEFIFYREQKISIILFIIDRILMTGSIGVAGLLNNQAGLIISLACLLGISGGLKLVYVIMGVHKLFFEEETEQTQKMIQNSISSNILFKGENDQYSSSHFNKGKMSVLNQSPETSPNKLKLKGFNNVADKQFLDLASVDSRQLLRQNQKLEGVNNKNEQQKVSQSRFEKDQKREYQTNKSFLKQKKGSKGDNSSGFKDDISIHSLNQCKQLLIISERKKIQDSNHIEKNMEKVNEDIVFDQQLFGEERSHQRKLSSYLEQDLQQDNPFLKQNDKQKDKQNDKQKDKQNDKQKYVFEAKYKQNRQEQEQEQEKHRQDKFNKQLKNGEQTRLGKEQERMKSLLIEQLQMKQIKKDNQEKANHQQFHYKQDEKHNQQQLSQDFNDFLQIKNQNNQKKPELTKLIKQEQQIKKIQIFKPTKAQKKKQESSEVDNDKLQKKIKSQQANQLRVTLQKVKQNTLFQQSPQKGDLSINLKGNGVKLNVKKNIKSARMKLQDFQSRSPKKQQKLKIQYQMQDIDSMQKDYPIQRKFKIQEAAKTSRGQAKPVEQLIIEKQASANFLKKVEEQDAEFKQQETKKKAIKKPKNLKSTLQIILNDADDDDDLESIN